MVQKLCQFKSRIPVLKNSLLCKAYFLSLAFVLSGFAFLQGQNTSCLCNTSACTTNGIIDFTTGLDNSTNSLMPVQAVDTDWRLAAILGFPAPNIINPVVRAAEPNWINNSSIFANWLRLGYNIGVPTGPFTFEYCMDVCSDSVTVLPFKVFAFEEISAVRLGGSTVYTSPGYTIGNLNDFQVGILINGQVLAPDLNGQVCLQIDVTTHSQGAEPAFLVKGRAAGTFINDNCEVNSNTISGIVFDDRNANGIQDFGEAPLPSRTVRLNDTQSGQTINTTITDNAGYYQFYNITTGNRTVTTDITPGWTPTNPSSASYIFNITGGCTNLNFDFGFRNSTTPIPPNDCNPPDSSCTTNFIYLDTGIDHENQAVVPLGGNDPYWKVVSAPSGSSYSLGGFGPIRQPVTAWFPNTLSSRWIAPADFGADPNAAAGCPYTYQRCFSTCDSGTVYFDFRVFADNYVREIRVDGIPIANYNPTPNESYTFFEVGIPVQASLNLSGGYHCLEVDVINGRASSGATTPTGFKLEGFVSGSKLLKDSCQAPTRCPIIPLDRNMMVGGIATGLVNEQNIVGDPVNGVLGNLGAPWQFPGSQTTDILDLGQVYDLCNLYLYDHPNKTGNFEVEYEDLNNPGTWITLLPPTAMTLDLLIPTNISAQRLRFTIYQGGDVNEIVLYGSPSSRSNIYKIPLTASMFGPTPGGAEKLVDEQGFNPYDNPAVIPGPTTAWINNNQNCFLPDQCTPPPNPTGNCAPQIAELDLGAPYLLDAICLYDGIGCGDFGIEYDDNGIWTALVPGGLINTNQFQTWRIYDQLNIYTSRLRFTNTVWKSRINEIILYGRSSVCTPSGQVVPRMNNPIEDLGVDQVIEANVQGELLVFPNPATDVLTLTLPDGQMSAGEVSLYNLNGQLVQQQRFIQGTANVQLSLQGLESGMYMISVTSGNDRWNKKVVKRR